MTDATSDDNAGVEAEECLFSNLEQAKLWLASWPTGPKSIARRELIVQEMENLRLGAMLLEQLLAGRVIVDVEPDDEGVDQVTFYDAPAEWAAELEQRAARKVRE